MNWRGHAFEILCMHHIAQIKNALGISGVKTRCFPWTNLNQEDSVQIDLIIERDDWYSTHGTYIRGDYIG